MLERRAPGLELVVRERHGGRHVLGRAVARVEQPAVLADDDVWRRRRAEQPQPQQCLPAYETRPQPEVVLEVVRGSGRERAHGRPRGGAGRPRRQIAVLARRHLGIDAGQHHHARRHQGGDERGHEREGAQRVQSRRRHQKRK
jgi:hypothetical protein